MIRLPSLSLTANSGAGGLPLLFSAPLQTTVVPSRARGSATPTFTRATTKYIVDFEGLYKPILSGEVGFSGARRVANLIAQASLAGYRKSEDITSWAPIFATINSSTSTTFTDATDSRVFVSMANQGGNRVYQVRLELQGTAGDKLNICFLDNTTYSKGGGIQYTLTSSYQKVSFLVTSSSATETYDLLITNRNLFGLGLGSAAPTFNMTKMQVEDVTGQTNQNPSEYVSVGVLSAPYHGACVDGVKYFSTLNGNTVSSNVVTEATGAAINSSTAKFGVVDGSATGSYFSTPDKAALQPTSSVRIQALISMPTWTPAARSAIYGQFSGGAPTTDGALAEFAVETNGSLRTLLTRNDGTQVNAIATTLLTGLVNSGGSLWVRADFTLADTTTIFYTSQDGVNWSTLGTPVVSSTITSFNNSALAIAVGAGNSFASHPMAGRVYRLQYYADGVLALDFNPNLSTSAQTFTAATGEVWTSNGTARIFGNTNTTYGIPAPWDATGPVGYNAEPQAINLCLQSQTLETTWSASNTTVVSNQTVAPDGTTTGDLFYPTTTGTYRRVLQSLTNSVATYTFSTYAKAAGMSFLYFLDPVLAANGCWFNLGTGLVGTNATGMTATMTAVGNGWYRCTLSGTSAIAAVFSMGVADADNSITATTSGTNGIYVWGMQNETGSVATSPITTTTVAVTRNADVLTYDTPGNFNGTVGSAYVEAGPLAGILANGTMVGKSAGGLYVIYTGGADNLMRSFDGTNNNPLAVTGSYLTGSRKLAVTWAGSTMTLVQSGTAGSPATFDGDYGSTGTFTIGCRGASDALGGNIRNVRIYGTALSAAQLQAMTA